MEDYQRYLDPKTLDRLSGLELQARLIVEGFVSGRHKSPYKGSSVEFREHREYSPGDDLRFIDWKVYAKSDRYYIKEYEEETNLKSYLVVDTSASMAYGSGEVSKLDYARFASAAMTHLISQQQDAVALVLWNEELQKFLPPGMNPLHISNIYQELANAVPEESTDLALLLKDIGERVRQRSLIVVFSDFLDADIEGVLRGLNLLRHKGHDVILMHVLDEAEVDFPFQDLTRFEGLEDISRLLIDPKALREAYIEELEAFVQKIKSTCISNGMDYVSLRTSTPLDVALSGYLARRAGTLR